MVSVILVRPGFSRQVPVTGVADRLGYTDAATVMMVVSNKPPRSTACWSVRVYRHGTTQDDARAARIMGEILSS